MNQTAETPDSRDRGPRHMPSNERRACDAVARILERRHGASRSEARCPERDGLGPPVDYWFHIGDQIFAVEHTRLEAFVEQIRTGVDFNVFVEPIERALDGNMPAPGLYSLIFPIDPTAGIPRKEWPRLRQSLIEWANSAALALHKEAPVRLDRDHDPRGYDGTRTATIGDIEVRLARRVHWAEDGRFDGRLHVMRIAPRSVETRRRKRIRIALDAKCPKLMACKNLGARTILLLENVDIALTNHSYVSQRLERLLPQRNDPPDEIFYLDATTDRWTIWSIVREGTYWPEENRRPPYDEFNVNDLAVV